ncbi:sensor histidine kinase [Kineococcus indalonis]|uniref:sensor histidine kinase n=1 Tax=Kineococcus indalonis TaxID=2696566 RepID=UPI001411D835|nr:sensor histidine kinase [Kineococcus indalonis]NAZ84745.1 sensor histidine kinase [Kineococcus indalonis]
MSSTVSSTAPGTAELWIDRTGRWSARLPYPLLALSAALAAALTAQGWSTWQRWWQLLGVAALLAALTALFERRPRPVRVALAWFAVRWALSLVLVLGNPFYGVYVWVGNVDAVRFFPFRRALWGIAATAVLVALSQSAGPPALSPAQLGGFVLLCVFNAGVATLFSSQALLVERRSEERRAAVAQLSAANRRLREAQAENAGLHAQLVAQAREAGVLDERARLAREIHDTIAQGLTGVVTQLQAAQAEPAEAARRERVEKALASARDCLAEARRSVRALRPVALEEEDLTGALRRLAHRRGGADGPAVAVVVTGEPVEVTAEASGALLRTAQEALANATRHAGASSVTVTLTGMEDEVVLDVRDDGRGFEPARVDGRGFGLESMRQRIRLAGGSLHVESAPGEGTAVCAVVPLAGGTGTRPAGPGAGA